MGDVNTGVVERFKRGLDALELAIEDLEPDPAAEGWLGERTRVAELKRIFDEEVDGQLPEVLQHVDDSDVTASIQGRVAHFAANVAVYCHLSGDGRSYADYLERALRLEPDDAWRKRYDAAKRAPDVYAKITYGEWLHLHKRYGDAKRVIKSAKTSLTDPELLAAADEVLDAPRPLTSAPTLWRLNGCGQGLYGNRDARPDGSYISTLCLCLIFVPIIPIRAYRLWDEDGGYSFQSIVPLSGFAKMARVLLLAAAGLGILGYGVNAHYNSDSYKAGALVAEAAALEEQGEGEQAIEKYRTVLGDYLYSPEASTDIAAASTGIVRVAAAKVKAPVTAASLDQIALVANTVSELPSTHNQDAIKLFVTQLVGWAEAIGDKDTASARARLAVVDMALPYDEQQALPLRQKALATLADALAAERPLTAAALYMQLDPVAPAVLTKTQAIFDTFPSESPSLWMATAEPVRRWLDEANRTNDAGLTKAAKRFGESLSQAREQQPTFQKLIEDGDEQKLADANKADIHNQEVAVAVAATQLQTGDVTPAIALLEGSAKPGLMLADTLLLLGRLYRDAGMQEKADDLLTPYIDDHLMAFQRVNREYNSAADAVQQRLLKQLQQGNVPPALRRKLEATIDEEAQNVLIREHLWSTVRNDPELATLRKKYLAHQALVPISLTLGMVKLARANGAAGAERTRFLSEAEHAFLSIRGAAEGQPSYHLGLAEVFHRLGKVKEGEAELAGVLARNDAPLSIQVASTYRGLGKLSKARAILEKVQAEAEKPEHQHHAAHMLSIIAESLEETEKWLKKADQSSPVVKMALISNRGQLALRAGDTKAADAAFAESAQFWMKNAQTDPIAANNAAVAWRSRYRASGKLAHIRKAAETFELGLRQQPDAPLMMQNLQETLLVVGLLDVLKDHFKVDVLAPESREAQTLLTLLLTGDEAVELRRKLRVQPDLRRALELAKQAQVLAPHRQGNYRTEISWLVWTEDIAGMRKLHERIAQGQKIDISQVAERRRSFERGERDEQLRKHHNSEIRQNGFRLERAKGTGHTPTIAAAEILTADTKYSQFVTLGEGSLEESLSYYRAAHKRWAHPGIADRLAAGLFGVAVLKARDDAPALAAAYDKHKRQQNHFTIAAELVQAPGGEAVRAALVGRPELQEALKVGVEAIRKGDDISYYLMAVWAQEDELAHAAAAVLDNEMPHLRRQIDVLLSPGEDGEASELRVFETAKKQQK